VTPKQGFESMTCVQAGFACGTQHMLHGVLKVGFTSVLVLLRTQTRVLADLQAVFRGNDVADRCQQ
jgi:hypothetical protein